MDQQQDEAAALRSAEPAEAPGDAAGGGVRGRILRHSIVSGTVRTVKGTVKTVGGWLLRGGRADAASAAVAAAAAVEITRQAPADAALAPASSSAAFRFSQCPSEWFVADDERARTRYFVIQGSDSLASWKANLAFDPVPFEGTRVKVHRGVYEASLALYDTLLPYVEEFAEHNKRRAFRLAFTGHSLGGSLATVVVLLLNVRRPDLAQYVEPVWTFGAPHVFCSGCCAEGAAEGAAPAKGPQAEAKCQDVLGQLGVAPDLVRNVMMHLVRRLRQRNSRLEYAS